MAEKEPDQDTLPEGTIQVPEGAVTTIQAPNMPTVYVSSAGFAAGPMDVRLFLGDAVPNPDGSGVTNTQRLCLIMAPEFAKALGENLLRSMEYFETRFGKIRDLTPRKQATDQPSPK